MERRPYLSPLPYSAFLYPLPISQRFSRSFVHYPGQKNEKTAAKSILTNAESSIESTGMDFGWGPESYTIPYGNLDVEPAYLAMPLGASDGNSRYALHSSAVMTDSRLIHHGFSFADPMPSFTSHAPAEFQTQNCSSGFADPMPSFTNQHPAELQTKDCSFDFANAMSSFTNQDPDDYKLDPAASPVHPMNMSPGPDPSMAPSSFSRHDSGQESSAALKSTTPSAFSRHDSAQGSSSPFKSTTPSASSRHGSAQESSATLKSTPSETPETPDEEEYEESFKPESDSTHRARYAANQRHARTRSARQASNNPTDGSHTPEADPKEVEKKQRLREKNKVAAAKCRQHQRKQAETIRAKCGRLGETNAQLKSYIQELRGELNGLRAVALGHGECDERLARYNQVQVQRLMRDYYSACGGLAGAMIDRGQALQPPQ